MLESGVLERKSRNEALIGPRQDGALECRDRVFHSWENGSPDIGVSDALLSPTLVSLTSTLRPSVSPTLSRLTAMARRAVVMQTQCSRSEAATSIKQSAVKRYTLPCEWLGGTGRGEVMPSRGEV